MTPFHCPRWPACNCPDGTFNDDCPAIAALAETRNSAAASSRQAETAAPTSAATSPDGDTSTPSGDFNVEDVLAIIRERHAIEVQKHKTLSASSPAYDEITAKFNKLYTYMGAAQALYDLHSTLSDKAMEEYRS